MLIKASCFGDPARFQTITYDMKIVSFSCVNIIQFPRVSMLFRGLEHFAKRNSIVSMKSRATVMMSFAS